MDSHGGPWEPGVLERLLDLFRSRSHGPPWEPGGAWFRANFVKTPEYPIVYQLLVLPMSSIE